MMERVMENLSSLRSSEDVVVLIDFGCLVDLESSFAEYFWTHFQNSDPKKRVNVNEWRHCEILNNFPSKYRKQAKEVWDSPDFWETLPYTEQAMVALKEMRGMGLDVRILISSPKFTHVVPHIINWVNKIFKSPVWLNRIIYCVDKTFLPGNYLIDSDPSPETSQSLVGRNIARGPLWKHVIYDKPYNRDLDVARLKTWVNWKEVLGLDHVSWLYLEDGSERPYFNHGSPDSRDKDRYYQFSVLPPVEDCHIFCQGVTIDRNLIEIDPIKNVVRNVHKGNPDESNNAVFDTYHLHKQAYPCPVKRRVGRLVPLKVVVTIRKIVGIFTEKTQLRDKARAALKGPIEDKLEFLRAVNFEEIGPQLSVENLKLIAFQLAITLGLVNGKEYYTKGSAAEAYPLLHPFLYRNEVELKKNYHLLNGYTKELINSFQSVDIGRDGEFVFFYYNPPKIRYYDGPFLPIHKNYFALQCNGFIMSIRDKAVIYPLDNNFITEPPSWVQTNSNSNPSTYPPFPKLTSKESLLVSVTRFEGNIEVFDQKGDKSVIALAKDILAKDYNLSDPNLFHLEEYFYIFELLNTNKLILVAQRDKLTLDLQLLQ
eukprot:TRINITY_DN26689_c0_g1_i1.p1 TRINITY_DN26689_c0_g1~~TRINITY_DN26689_c0_g1_i1.p1  ORF type:complete len:596 (+),score=139.26 TRINITY_DN26689_c0_g1_i1:69-1856(+)